MTDSDPDPCQGDMTTPRQDIPSQTAGSRGPRDKVRVVQVKQKMEALELLKY